MKIYKTAIRIGDAVFSADTIEHEGAFWLVPEWLEHLAEGTIQPARMIRVSPPDFHPADGTGFDFALGDSIPIDVLEGRTAEHYDVQVLPDIRIDNPESSSLY